MSNAIQPFAFEDHLVRTIMDDGGEPWFVAKDVCRVLEIANHRDAVAQLDEDEKDGVGISDAIGREQETTIISESGLYALVFRSRKPQAREFSRWVRKEVLPSLRRTGRYALTSESLEDALANLSPRVRLHCLRLAVQVALAANAPQGVEATFARFCSLVKERPTEERATAHDLPGLLRQFVQQCCRPQAGSCLSGRDLYEAFLRWCKTAGIAPGCTIKAVSSTVQALDLLRVRQTRPYISFDGVCLCRDVQAGKCK
jgi:toxin-antitoxin system, toxin component, bro family